MTEITALLASVAPAAIRAAGPITAVPDFALLLAGVTLSTPVAANDRRPLAEGGKALPVRAETSLVTTRTAAHLVTNPQALDVVLPAPADSSPALAPGPRSDTPSLPPTAIVGTRIAKPVSSDVAQPAEPDAVEPLDRDRPNRGDEEVDATTPDPVTTGIGQPAILPVPAALPIAPQITAAPVDLATTEPARRSTRTPAKAGAQAHDAALDTAGLPKPTPVSTAKPALSGRRSDLDTKDARPTVAALQVATPSPATPPEPTASQYRAASTAIGPAGLPRTPAKAGVQARALPIHYTGLPNWAPAFAGVPVVPSTLTDALPAVVVTIAPLARVAIPEATAIQRPALPAPPAEFEEPPNMTVPVPIVVIPADTKGPEPTMLGKAEPSPATKAAAASNSPTPAPVPQHPSTTTIATIAPDLGPHSTSTPAGQAFASAVFAAAETPRPKPAPRGMIAELAIIAGIDTSLPTTIPSVPHTAAPRLDTSRAEWIDGMIDRIEMLTTTAGADRRETRIRLNPDQLGSVEIAIERDGDTTHLRFTAEAPATRTLLAEALPRLGELADARGLRLGQTQIDAGDTAAQSNAQQQHRHPDPRADAARAAPVPVPDAAIDAADPTHRIA